MLAEKIRELRQKRHLTQEELSNRLGVDRTLVVKWETGVSTPRLAIISKLASELRCKPSFLLP